jgi:uncharacterized protein YjbI with pentapeptide repeats
MFYLRRELTNDLVGPPADPTTVLSLPPHPSAKMARRTRPEGEDMKLRALMIIAFLATVLPWLVAAVTREELVCPVRADWGAQDWEQWEKEETENGIEWSGDCPCKENWKPTKEQLQDIRIAHMNWLQNLVRQNPTNVGQAILCNADLQNTDLQGANLIVASPQGTFLFGANLQKAQLWGTNLQEADLSNANLQEADLHGAQLGKANLRGANLQKVDLKGAKLEEAELSFATLQEADLTGADVENTRLANAKLAGAIYAPASPPRDGYVEGITGLASVVIPFLRGTTAVSGMVQLRELLHEAGLRERERQARPRLGAGRLRRPVADQRLSGGDVGADLLRPAVPVIVETIG